MPRVQLTKGARAAKRQEVKGERSRGQQAAMDEARQYMAGQHADSEFYSEPNRNDSTVHGMPRIMRPQPK